MKICRNFANFLEFLYPTIRNYEESQILTERERTTKYPQKNRLHRRLRKTQARGGVRRSALKKMILWQKIRKEPWAKGTARARRANPPS